MKILAICGSLRRDSTNSRLLRAAELLAPAGTVIRQSNAMGTLPHFNPDDDDDHPPALVVAFRAEIAWADALIISSPEYAHGVPGTLKNALDWLVGGGEIINKPIALINASARSTIAHAQLRETLTVMSTRVVPEASITIPLDGRRIDEHAMVADPEIASALKRVMDALAAATEQITKG
jgi:chromate reductase